MAHLLRLIFAVLVTAFSLSAVAAVPMVTGYYVVRPELISPTKSGACDLYRDYWTANNGAAGGNHAGPQRFYLNDNNCLFDTLNAANVKQGEVLNSIIAVPSGSCPVGSSKVGGSCTCTAPLVEDSTHTSCVQPPDPCLALKGGDAGEWWRDVGVNDAGTGPKSRSFSVCDGYNPIAGGKCVATVSNANCTNSDTDGLSGFWRCSGHAMYTGTSGVGGKCDPTSAGKGSGETPQDPSPATPPIPGTDPPKPPPKPADGLPAPAPCPAGQAPGSVNGTSACYPTGSDTPKAGGRDSSTTNSDGSKETTHEETTCNAGGSKCSTDTTKCVTPAGSSTPTCTTTNSTDTATGTCAKSPGNSVCAGGNGSPGSSFGGDCNAGFQAKGEDPILNAMALEQYRRNCETFRTDKEPSTWLTAEGQKTTNVMADSPNNVEFSIGPGSFDTSDALGGGGCSLNKTVTVRGYSVALPFNVLCDPLAIFGQILVAFAFLLGARIVTRG